MGKAKKDKRERWTQFPDRLKDALVSNVHEDQIENLKYNVSLLRSNLFTDGLKRKLLVQSITNGSKECALFLIEQGAVCNPCFLPLECKYDKIHLVCDLLEEIVYEYPKSFTSASGQGAFTTLNIDKKALIKRILEPRKISENPKRVDYIMTNTKFFETKEIKEVIDEQFKSNPEKWSALISLLRDIKLKELGI